MLEVQEARHRVRKVCPSASSPGRPAVVLQCKASVIHFQSGKPSYEPPTRPANPGTRSVTSSRNTPISALNPHANRSGNTACNGPSRCGASALLLTSNLSALNKLGKCGCSGAPASDAADDAGSEEGCEGECP